MSQRIVLGVLANHLDALHVRVLQTLFEQSCVGFVARMQHRGFVVTDGYSTADERRGPGPAWGPSEGRSKA